MKNTLIILGILVVILIVAFIATNLPAENKCSKKGKCTGPFGLCFRCDRRFPALAVSSRPTSPAVRQGIYAKEAPLYPDTRAASVRGRRMF